MTADPRAQVNSGLLCVLYLLHVTSSQPLLASYSVVTRALSTITLDLIFPSPRPAQTDPGYNLLPRKSRKDGGKKCLVLDLDETLVHSSFKVGGRTRILPSAFLFMAQACLHRHPSFF